MNDSVKNTAASSETRDDSVADTDSVPNWLGHVQFVLEAALKDSEGHLVPFYDKLVARLRDSGINIPAIVNTPYWNTISTEDEPPFPGDGAIERRIRSYIRWNAMAMVVNANVKSHGIGGHISTYASSATLYETGFNHFFRGATPERPRSFQ